MGSVGSFPVTGRQMRPVTDENPTELFEITARDIHQNLPILADFVCIA